MCGYFGNVCTCIYCVLYCFVYIYLFSFFSNLTTLPQRENSIVVNNNNNNNNNNNKQNSPSRWLLNMEARV